MTSFDNLPRQFATEQWLGVLAEQNEEILRLLREQNDLLRDSRSPASGAEITEPSPAGSKASSRSTSRASSAAKKD